MKNKSSGANLSEDIIEKIDLYVNKQLDPSEIQDLWSELVGHPEALDYLKTVANLRKIAEDEQKQVHGKGSGRIYQSRTWMWAAAAAAIVLVVLIGQFRSEGELVTVSPLAQIELDYYRSSDDQPERTDEENVIREAIVLANRGDAYLAIQLLDSTLGVSNNPIERARLHLNAGSILYNLARYEEAAERFEQIIRMEIEELQIQERTYWYLGNAYFQLNRLKEAKHAFQQTYELNGAYKRVAERYLQSLPA